MKGFELPEKVRRFLVPGVLLFSLLLLTGGLHFRNQSLGLPLEETTNEDEGVVSGVEAGLPENFPEDIPLFEPADILSSLESQGRIQITAQTDASTERVAQFYKREMLVWDWQPVGSLSFLKDGRRAELTVTAESGGPTTIILTITP